MEFQTSFKSVSICWPQCKYQLIVHSNGIKGTDLLSWIFTIGELDCIWFKGLLHSLLVTHCVRDFHKRMIDPNLITAREHLQKWKRTQHLSEVFLILEKESNWFLHQMTKQSRYRFSTKISKFNHSLGLGYTYCSIRIQFGRSHELGENSKIQSRF